MYIYTHTHIYRQWGMYTTCKQLASCIHICIYMYIHTYTHIYIRIYMNTYRR